MCYFLIVWTVDKSTRQKKAAYRIKLPFCLTGQSGSSDASAVEPPGLLDQ